MGAKAGIRLEAIRDLLRGLIAAGETDKAIDQAMLIITEQAQRLDRLLRERYGVKSEKVSPEQLRLALAELARESEEQALPAAPEPSDEPASKPVKEKKPAVRRPLPPTLERIEHRHVPEDCAAPPLVDDLPALSLAPLLLPCDRVQTHPWAVAESRPARQMGAGGCLRRYLLRPPFAHDAVTALPGGCVRVSFKAPGAAPPPTLTWTPTSSSPASAPWFRRPAST